jgi:hypothetical protein
MLLVRSKYGRMRWNNERRQLLFYTVDVSLLVETQFLLADTEERFVEKLILRTLSVCSCTMNGMHAEIRNMNVASNHKL